MSLGDIEIEVVEESIEVTVEKAPITFEIQETWPAGRDGSDGATWPAGADGATWPAGADGADGNDWADWADWAWVDAVPCCFQTLTVSQVSGAKTIVTIDATTIANANATLSANGIALSQAWVYCVSYAMILDDDGTTGAIRKRCDAYMELDASAVAQSYCWTYTRESSGGSGISTSFLVDVPTDWELKLYTDGDGATPDISIDNVQISIHRVS